MEQLPRLPEHEVCVVNTFVEMKEKKPKVARAVTAPAGTLECPSEPSEDSEEAAQSPQEDEEDAPSRARRRAHTAAVPALACEDPGDEEEEEEEETADMKSMTSMSSQPSIRRITTPDMWERDQPLATAQTARQDNGNSEPSSGRPSLRRMDTPDHWERETMIERHLQAGVQAAQAAQPLLPPQSLQMPRQVTPIQVHAPQQAAFPVTGYPQLPQVPTIFLMAPAMHLSPVPSPVHSPQQDQPVLLGRTSPSASPSAQSEKDGLLGPGALACEVMANGKERVRWSVDGHKLDSNSEKLLSPEFKLSLPGQDALPFRLMVLATQTGGKHGAGFKKARGRGSIEIKCLGSVPPGVLSTALRVTVGTGNRRQSAPGPVCHNFADKNCCPLQRGEEPDWDLKAAVGKDSKCFEICLEVVKHASETA